MGIDMGTPSQPPRQRPATTIMTRTTSSRTVLMRTESYMVEGLSQKIMQSSFRRSQSSGRSHSSGKHQGLCWWHKRSTLQRIHRKMKNPLLKWLPWLLPQLHQFLSLNTPMKTSSPTTPAASWLTSVRTMLLVGLNGLLIVDALVI